MTPRFVSSQSRQRYRYRALMPILDLAQDSLDFVEGQADRAQTIHRPARRGLARNPKLDVGRETGGPESHCRSAAEPETGCGLASPICSFSSLAGQGEKKRLGTGFVRVKMAVR